jgi:VIT1/CCC1 family predicted Fe2+/Mn2+ transporter
MTPPCNSERRPAAKAARSASTPHRLIQTRITRRPPCYAPPYAGPPRPSSRPARSYAGRLSRCWALPSAHHQQVGLMRHIEVHRTHRTGWLRAAVLGANDGIVSTASLVLGVAAAGANSQGILVAGVAGLVAGAMSMAAGEYVSVSSQADTEQADLARESKELASSPDHEHTELTAVYVKRGLEAALASSVATQLMQHDALGAHARDELGISDTLAARPVQAAFASAGTFAVGAVLPILVVLLFPASALVWAVSGSSLLFLALLGALAAHAGGAPVIPAATRVTFWGAFAMALTAGVGALFG